MKGFSGPLCHVHESRDAAALAAACTTIGAEKGAACHSCVEGPYCCGWCGYTHECMTVQRFPLAFDSAFSILAGQRVRQFLSSSSSSTLRSLIGGDSSHTASTPTASSVTRWLNTGDQGNVSSAAAGAEHCPDSVGMQHAFTCRPFHVPSWSVLPTLFVAGLSVMLFGVMFRFCVFDRRYPGAASRHGHPDSTAFSPLGSPSNSAALSKLPTTGPRSTASGSPSPSASSASAPVLPDRVGSGGAAAQRAVQRASGSGARMAGSPPVYDTMLSAARGSAGSAGAR